MDINENFMNNIKNTIVDALSILFIMRDDFKKIKKEKNFESLCAILSSLLPELRKQEESIKSKSTCIINLKEDNKNDEGNNLKNNNESCSYEMFDKDKDSNILKSFRNFYDSLNNINIKEKNLEKNNINNDINISIENVNINNSNIEISNIRNEISHFTNNFNNISIPVSQEEIEFKSIKDKIFLFINIIPKKISKLNFKNIYPFIGKGISKQFDIETTNIFIKYNDNFENLVNTKNFVELPLEKFEFFYDNSKFKPLYEFKNLYENLLRKKFKLPKDLFDYKLNHIDHHFNNMICYGIGLNSNYNKNKIINNADDNYITTYRGIKSKLKPNGIEFVLKSLLCPETLINKSFFKKDEGIYLSFNINNVIEKYSQLIKFNGKPYAIVLEAKVNNKYIKNYQDKFDKEFVYFRRILIIEKQ